MSPRSQFFLEASVGTRQISHVGPITIYGTQIGLFVTVALPSRKKTLRPLIFVSDGRDVVGAYGHVTDVDYRVISKDFSLNYREAHSFYIRP